MKNKRVELTCLDWIGLKHFEMFTCRRMTNHFPIISNFNSLRLPKAKFKTVKKVL